MDFWPFNIFRKPADNEPSEFEVVREGEAELVVRTSEADWLPRALELYREKSPFTFIDDAGLGLDAKDLGSAVSLMRAARGKGGATIKTIVSVLTGLGLSGAGLWMVAAAILDPEPTSKLGLLIAGGTLITLTGGLGTFHALGIKFVITGKGPGSEFKIEPKD